MSPGRHMVHAVRQDALERRHVRVAVVMILALALVSVVVFSKQKLRGGDYEIRGVFASANQLKPGSEVRIAGVRVGKVGSIREGPAHSSIVVMRMDDAAQPIHRDATLEIKPRLLLEGNFYVRVSPGSARAPELESGATIPLGQTSVPVQIDQVLDTFDLPTRSALQRSIAGLAAGLGNGSAPSRGAGDTRTGYDGLRRAVRALDGALADVQTVAHSARGRRAGDLARAVESTSRLTAQLARDPAALAELVRSSNRFTRSLAAEDQALGQSLRGIAGALRAAPRGLRALDAALPAATDFGEALRPALRAAPGALRKMNGLLGQLRPLVGHRELRPLLDELEPVTARLPELEVRLRALLPLVTAVNRCLSDRVVPTLDSKIEDGPHTSKDPAWLDMLHGVTGTTGLVPGFDGNGVALRLGITEGASAIRSVLPGIGQVAGFSPDVLGVRPTWLGYGVEPPYRPDEWCTEQAAPDLGKRSGPAPAWMTSATTLTRGPKR